MLIIYKWQIEQGRGDQILRGLKILLDMCARTGDAPVVEIR